MTRGFAGVSGVDVRIVVRDGARQRDFVGRPAPALDEVVERGMILTAVAYRGWSEVRERTPAQRHLTAQRLVGWLDRRGLAACAEPDEARILTADVGELSHEENMGAAWRLEGAVVMAWAARLVELPRYHELARLPAVMDAMDGLPEGRRAGGPLRPEHEVLRVMRCSMDLLGVMERIGALFGDPRFGNDESSFRELEFAGYDLMRSRQDERDLVVRAAFERAKATRWLMGLNQTYCGVTVPLRESTRELM